MWDKVISRHRRQIPAEIENLVADLLKRQTDAETNLPMLEDETLDSDSGNHPRKLVANSEHDEYEFVETALMDRLDQVSTTQITSLNLATELQQVRKSSFFPIGLVDARCIYMCSLFRISLSGQNGRKQSRPK
jgi:hypothetical protein